MLENLTSLKRELAAIQPKVATGEMDHVEALEKAVSGIQLLANVVEGLVKDYKQRA